MIRCRFQTSPNDPRPVVWPIKHPYWHTGSGFDYSIVVAYADDEAEILRNWPDATNLDSEEVTEYVFTDRFAKPDWFNPEQPLDKVVEAVRADLLRRSQLGIKKYGVTLERTDLSLKDWLQHAYEETLDQANYLKRAIIAIEQHQQG